MNRNKDNRNLSLLLGYIPLKPQLISHKPMNKHVQNGPEFLIISYNSMTINKLRLLIKLLKIHIRRPNQSRKDVDCGRESLDIGIHFLEILVCHEGEQDVHNDRRDNHNHRNINKTVIQTSHQCQHKDQPRRLQRLTLRRVYRIAENDYQCVEQQYIRQLRQYPRQKRIHSYTKQGQRGIIVYTNISILQRHR